MSAALWPWVIVVCAAAATYLWRALGVALAGRIRPDSPLLEWVSCVAYALLAGLITRMIVLPIGPLAETPLELRVGVAIGAFGLYLLMGRRVILPVIAGAAAFSAWMAVAA